MRRGGAVQPRRPTRRCSGAPQAAPAELYDRTLNMKRFRILISLVTSGVFSSYGLAADAPQKTVVAGPFEINLVVTENGDELFNSWDRPTGKPFNVVPVKVAPRGKFLSAVVLFKGCKADGSGNCNAELDIIAYDPKGKVYGEMPKVELWQKKPAPDPSYTQLSRSYMGIVIEPKDPPGTYRITAVARDLNAKAEARSEARFEVK